MNLPKEVNILGTTYKIIYQTRQENKYEFNDIVEFEKL